MLDLVNQLALLDASRLAEAIRLRQVSVSEVMAAHFHRIDKLNNKYNAIVAEDREGAIEKAKMADIALDKGVLWGPLHGVPVTIKDSIDVVGFPTSAGVKKYQNNFPKQDADVAKKIRQAGAIIIGKTNCAKACCDVQTSNTLFGKTNNPYDVRCTSGGSSGGEAVAVSLGFSALGIGSDSGGSIRIPASYCGVLGFKPSINKVSVAGHFPPFRKRGEKPDSLTVVGPIARSIQDVILCMEILFSERIEKRTPTKSPRICWTMKFGSQVVDDEVVESFTNFVEFMKTTDAKIENVRQPFDLKEVHEYFLLKLHYEFLTREAGLTFYFKFWLSQYLGSIFGGLEHKRNELNRFQSELASDISKMFEDFDCWILPATPSTAFQHTPAGSPRTMLQNGKEIKVEYFSSVAGFTFPFSLSGNPSIVMPIGKNKRGMPISIQLVGKVNQDVELLRCAKYIENVISSNSKKLCASSVVVGFS